MRLWSIIALGGLAACSLDWGELDPRENPIGNPTTTTTSAGGATTSSRASSTSTGDGGAAGGTGGLGGLGGAGGTSAPFFVDDFNRPDGTIGNDWREKQPNVFSLASGRVVKVVTMTTSYRDNLVYRPPSEDILDVEASVEFETLTTSVAFPQMFVRVQQSTVETPDAYDGYLLYVAGSATQAVLGRQLGTPFVSALESFTISPALEPGETYRLRFRAEGTNPVHLEAYVEEWTSNGWVIIGQAMHDDAAGTRIDDAGAVGFAGNEPDTFVFDNFSYRPLP